MTFKEKRLDYLQKAAKKQEWICLGPEDAKIFSDLSFTDWINESKRYSNDEKEHEIDELKEQIAHHLRRIERFKKTVHHLNQSLRFYCEESGDFEEELELVEPDDV